MDREDDQSTRKGTTMCDKSVQLKLRRIAFSLAGVLVLVGIVLLGLLWFATRTLAPVRVSFLGSTNDPAVPLVWGVFQVVNDLNEPFTSYGGVFEKWDGQNWSDTVGSYFANFGGERQYAPGTTNVVCTGLPKKEGRYRLAFRYYPKSRDTPKFYASPRYRLLEFFVRKGLISTRSRSGKVVIPGDYRVDPQKALVILLEPLDIPTYEQARQGAVVARAVAQ
jgi:hypothetical protein